MTEIIKQPAQQRPEPFNWSKYEKTHNNAIDLVAQCVGYNRANNFPLKAITLKHSYFELFRMGVQAIMKQKKMKFDETAELTFDGILIKKGSIMQFDAMLYEYHEMPKIEVN